MEIIGKQIELGIGVESVRGTAKTVAEKWLKKISATIVEKVEKKIDESTFNVLEDSQGTRIVRKWIEGELEGNVHADALGYLLYNLYGSVSSTLVATGVYSHAFSLGNTIQHPSLTLFAKDGANSQETFSNAMLSTLELSIVADDYLKFKAGFMASVLAANSDTPSYNTEYDFVGKDVVVKVATTEAGLTGAAAVKVKELTLTFDKGLVSDQVVGSYNPSDIFNTKMSIEGEMKLNYADDTFKDLFNTDVYRYMSITITGSQTIGTASNPKITLILNKVAVTDWTREDTRDELVPQTIQFKAFYNATDSEQSTATLVNVTSEYDEPIS